MSRIAFNKAIQELRVHFCRSSASSAGLREFMKTNYVELKKANPTLPILVREATGVVPKVTARYDKGEEATAVMADLDQKTIQSKFQDLC
ncbi:hypothetical protein AAMO2058_000871400 [Amorphochlora amoebiformis]|mmetsp:Transcript_6489/g.9986  ORF Transcript_6489/g.9986 Transcript_6489/m.9986 type:complete len:90 (-) Transcript_6489:86-355(-)|eukprot:1362920-Amorphochlora_amoeboformis.AAC.1